MLDRTWLALQRRFESAALRIVVALHPQRDELRVRWAQLMTQRAQVDPARPKRASALRLHPDLLPDERRELIVAFLNFAFARRHVVQTADPTVWLQLTPLDRTDERVLRGWRFPSKFYPADQPEQLIDEICSANYDRPMLLTYIPFEPVLDSMIRSMRRTSMWEVFKPWRLPDSIARNARALAERTNRRVEDVLVEWLGRAATEMPIELLSDEEVLAIRDLQLSETQQSELSDLLALQREDSLQDAARSRLDELLTLYRYGMVRKAQALKVAVERGLQPRLS